MRSPVLAAALASELAGSRSEEFLLHGWRRGAQRRLELTAVAALTELAAQGGGGGHLGLLSTGGLLTLQSAQPKESFAYSLLPRTQCWSEQRQPWIC
jgi:hypothetical protein